MTPSTDVAWAAGLFEGEGCICVRRRTYTKSPAVYVSVGAGLGSTDEDVVRRFHNIIGVGRVRVNHQPEQRGNKRQWEWTVGSRRDVATVLELLHPFLGSRRRKRADEALAACRISGNQSGAPTT